MANETSSRCPSPKPIPMSSYFVLRLATQLKVMYMDSQSAAKWNDAGWEVRRYDSHDEAQLAMVEWKPAAENRGSSWSDGQSDRSSNKRCFHSGNDPTRYGPFRSMKANSNVHPVRSGSRGRVVPLRRPLGLQLTSCGSEGIIFCGSKPSGLTR